MSKQFDRRFFLRGAGVGLALPMLESWRPFAHAAESASDQEASAKRFVCVAPDYGIYPEGFFPETAGNEYVMSPTLKSFENSRDEISIFSRLDHPGVGGGHACSRTLLNGVMASHLDGDRGQLSSLDQVIAQAVGMDTRFPSLVTGKGVPISYTQAGIPIPSVPDPDQFFNLLFVEDNKDVKERKRQALGDNGSILDVLMEDSQTLQRQLAKQDRVKLEEYLTAVRETERKLVRRKNWIDIPKPKAKAPARDEDAYEQSGYPYDMGLFFEVMVLALQTESTRVMVYQMPGGNRMFPFDGVTMGYHTLTHHGKDPEKAQQIQIIDKYYLDQLHGFIERLKQTKDRQGQALLDSTIVMFGSGMGNASSHSSRDLPVLLAGGGLRHGSHHAFKKDGKNGTPLADLYVTLLQQLGIETSRFASSRGDMNHLLI